VRAPPVTRDIDALDWMSDETKTEARRKLDAIANKIGYPDEWKGYAGIEISRDDFVGSMASAAAWDFAEDTAVDDVKLNGKLTLGENVADNGGLRIVLMALEDTLSGREAEKTDGFTPQQRLFLANAQVWCRNQTDEVARMLATVDPHSPGRWRVNGVVFNMPEFAEAFSCKADSPMVNSDPCRVW
jgi:predicted metalloendopeptidase